MRPNRLAITYNSRKHDILIFAKVKRGKTFSLIEAGSVFPYLAKRMEDTRRSTRQLVEQDFLKEVTPEMYTLTKLGDNLLHDVARNSPTQNLKKD
jgi:hypothetical protein